MNDNENFNPFLPEEESGSVPSSDPSGIPFFPEENYTNDITPPPFEASEPISENPEEATPFIPDEPTAYTPDEPVSDFSDEAPVFNASEEAQPDEPTAYNYNAPQEPVFNPYAPKNQTNGVLFGYQENTPSFTGQSPNTNGPINPSYNQPLNQNNYQFGNNAPYGNYNPQNNYQQPPMPKDNKNGKTVAIVIIAICVVVGIIALVSSFLSDKPGTEEQTFPSTTSSPTMDVPSTAPSQPQGAQIATTQPVASVDQSNSIWVAEKVRPVVVGVLAYQQGELAGEGSGVLMSEDAAKSCTYVITCAHVINEPGCEFSILLLDGSLYDAEIVALDERTDIGVLKVNTTGLPLAEFGDSSSLKIGEPIYAIGNPGGSEYFGSITNGIVSAIDRSISATYTMTCIQHNAAINPGNSGGALVNSAGQIIGINSSKIAKTDYEGMGFAVPSSIFKPVVDALIEHGYVPNRPELGIKYASVRDYQLYSLIVSIKGLPRESIIIAEIPEGSALSGTSAQVGDLIIAVNGQKMDNSNVLLDMIDTGAVGDTLTLTLCRVQSRSYETSTFDVTVQLVENKGSITTTTQPATLPPQDGFNGNFGDFGDFFDFFGW